MKNIIVVMMFLAVGLFGATAHAALGSAQDEVIHHSAGPSTQEVVVQSSADDAIRNLKGAVNGLSGNVKREAAVTQKELGKVHEAVSLNTAASAMLGTQLRDVANASTKIAQKTGENTEAIKSLSAQVSTLPKWIWGAAVVLLLLLWFAAYNSACHTRQYIEQQIQPLNDNLNRFVNRAETTATSTTEVVTTLGAEIKTQLTGSVEELKKAIEEVPKKVKELEPMVIEVKYEGRKAIYTPPIIDGQYLSLFIDKDEVHAGVMVPEELGRKRYSSKSGIYNSTQRILKAFLAGKLNEDPSDFWAQFENELIQSLNGTEQLTIS